MTLKEKLKGYSLAEALVTMFIIMLIASIAIPSIVGKRSKRVTYVIGPDDHGIIECESGQECEVQIPEGSEKDVFVTATGGGGGGAGSKCGVDIQHFEGSLTEDIKGNFSFKPNQVIHVEASAAGGASIQGNCDPYPGTFVQSEHDKNCDLFPQTKITYTTYYEEARRRYEWRCEDEATECKEYKKDEDGNSTDECSSWKHENICKDRPSLGEPYYTYHHSVKSSSTETASCKKSALSKTCSPEPSKYTSFPNIGNQVSWSKSISYDPSQEVIKTGRADVCSINWIHKPEVGDSKRYCNAAVFGGNGGSGQYYKQRLCPNADPTVCEEWREGHNEGSLCNGEEIDAYVQKNLVDSSGVSKCPFGVGYDLPAYIEKISSYQPTGFWDGLLQALRLIVGEYMMQNGQTYKECSGDYILEQMQKQKLCGHAKGEYNCYVDHYGASEKTCNRWKYQELKSQFVIGKAGKKDGQLRANDTKLFVEETGSAGSGSTWHKPGIENMSGVTLTGGDAGAPNVHGQDRGGRAGGKHTGMSQEYSKIPVPNTEDGQVGFVQARTYWVDSGYGGQAAETRSGYLKGSGTISVTVGGGGPGGQASVGSNGGDVVIKMGDQVIVAKGGTGGVQTRKYEECTAGESAIYPEDGELGDYPGKYGQPSKTDHGSGGDGSSGVPGPNCRDTNGDDGDRPGVILFY